MWNAWSSDLIHWVPDTSLLLSYSATMFGLTACDQVTNPCAIEIGGNTYVYFDYDDNTNVVAGIGCLVYTGWTMEQLSASNWVPPNKYTYDGSYVCTINSTPKATYKFQNSYADYSGNSTPAWAHMIGFTNGLTFSNLAGGSGNVSVGGFNSSNYIRVNDAIDSVYTATTISFLIKAYLTTGSGANNVIFSESHASGTRVMTIDGYGGNIRVMAFDGSNRIDSVGAYTNGNWVNIWAEYNIGGNIRGSVNDGTKYSTTLGSFSIGVSPTAAQLGQLISNTAQYLNGNISEFYVFNYVLPDATIAAFNAGTLETCAIPTPPAMGTNFRIRRHHSH
jgi:hypothetical protein